MTKLRTFLICPVRGVDSSISAAVVASLEAQGLSVHWPHRDTDQSDPIGLCICSTNRDAMAMADVVHVLWDGKSQGCLFDLGMAFAMRKPISVVEMPERTEEKSFQNMARAWEGTK